MEFSPIPVVLTSQFMSVAVWRERRNTGASTGSQMGLHETGHHRRSQAFRQHRGKSTLPDKLANNSHTHTMPAPAHFQELSKTEKGRSFFFYLCKKPISLNKQFLSIAHTMVELHINVLYLVQGFCKKSLATIISSVPIQGLHPLKDALKSYTINAVPIRRPPSNCGVKMHALFTRQ